MRRETISRAMGELDFDFICEAMEELDFNSFRETEEKLDFDSIYDAREGISSVSKEKSTKKHRMYFRRFAVCACAAMLVAALSFTTALAASESFRQAVISFFYPLYSDSEIKELGEGHRTSSFDEQDTLLTFLDRFNAEKMERGILAEYDSGYSYTFVENNKPAEGSLASILAVVKSDKDGYRLLITIEKKPYEETTGIWQIISYQVIDEETAQKILSEMPVHVPED